MNNTLAHIKRYRFLGILLVFLLAPGVLSQTVLAQDDTEPPEIIALDFTPTNIDTSAGPDSITITLQITDNLSGFDYGYLYFYSPSLQQYRNAYLNSSILVDEVNSIYEVTLTFPQYSEEGEWFIRHIQLYDITTNYRIYYEQDLSDLGFPTKLNITSAQDITPPELVSWDFEPNTIDTSAGPADITLTLTITDDISGLWYGWVYFYSPFDQQYQEFHVSPSHLVDEVNSIYELTLTFPQYSDSGAWNLQRAYFRDNTTNYRNYYEAELNSSGFPTILNVVSDPEDIVAPVLENIEIIPEVVNTILGPDTATFRTTITDDLSGLNYGYIRVNSPSGGQGHWVYISPYYLEEGSDVIYGLSKEFPRYSEYGEWQIDYIYMYDRTNNYRQYYGEELAAMGLPATFLMEGSIGGSENVIGPDGGVIATDDGMLHIDFPAGALSEDTEISITQVGRFEPVNIMIGTGTGLGNSVAEYDIEPDGLEFDVPVTVTMSVDVTDMNQNQRDRLNLYVYTDTDGDGVLDTFVPLPDDQILSIETTVNPDGTVFMTFTMQLDHFSIYAVILPIVDEGEDQCPDSPTLDTTSEYVGDQLVATVDGLASLLIAAEVLDSDLNTVAGRDVVFAVTNSNGELLYDQDPDVTCIATTDELGVAFCTLTDVPADVYTAEVFFDEVPGCYTSSAAEAHIVVYDPEAGAVVGKGSINSPEGAYRLDQSLTGDATFFFLSRYRPGKSIPTGKTQFHYQTGDLNFFSNVQEWLVVNQGGARAQFKGSGKINDVAAPTGEDYKFMLWAVDGKGATMGEGDTFRIKIWYEDGGEVIIYDNGVDQALNWGEVKIEVINK